MRRRGRGRGVPAARGGRCVRAERCGEPARAGARRARLSIVRSGRSAVPGCCPGRRSAAGASLSRPSRSSSTTRCRLLTVDGAGHPRAAAPGVKTAPTRPARREHGPGTPSSTAEPGPTASPGSDADSRRSSRRRRRARFRAVRKSRRPNTGRSARQHDSEFRRLSGTPPHCPEAVAARALPRPMVSTAARTSVRPGGSQPPERSPARRPDLRTVTTPGQRELPAARARTGPSSELPRHSAGIRPRAGDRPDPARLSPARWDCGSAERDSAEPELGVSRFRRGERRPRSCVRGGRARRRRRRRGRWPRRSAGAGRPTSGRTGRRWPR